MKLTKRILAFVLALVMVVGIIPVSAFAAEADATLTASLAKAKAYIDGITINNSSNDPATVVKNFKTHFTWDNEKRENSKSYLFDWSYYNGVVFEGIEYVYEVTGESVYKDYVVEYMSSMITAAGGWATCSNNSSKQAAGYNSTHGADCYKTASLLVDCYRMTGDQRYLTMAATLYADLDKAAGSYLLKNAGNNYRHTWASDPSPDLWLDGLYMILPFRAEYAKYIGDTEELDMIVSRMQWVSDNMYNSSKKLFYHAADSASSNSGTYWLRSIGWYAAAIVDIMDHMNGSNLETMKVQLKKLVDGMRACQNSSNGMWLNNMNASQSSSNPYETSGTALVCYAVMKAVNNGWLDESYADMAILAFNGICREKLSGSTLKDICFKGVPSGSNSTFYDNEGKGVGPFIMLYAELLEYVNKAEEEPAPTEPEVTEPEVTEPEVTEPEVTEPEATEPTEPSEPEEELPVYTGTSNLVGNVVYTLDSDGINSGEKYLIVYSGKALQNNNGVDNNPAVTVSSNTITLADDSTLAWTITLSSGNNYYVENNGSYINLSASGNDPIGSSKTVYITRSSSKYTFRNASGSGAYLRYSSSQLFCAGTSSSNNGMSLYRRTSTGNGDQVVFTLSPSANMVKPGSTLVLNGTVTVAGKNVDLNNCTITWSSADNGIATVSNGTVTGVATGKTTITATMTAANGKDLKNAIVLTVPVTVQGHDYKAVVTAPTCTEAGFTTYTCTICGESYVADEVAALGHDYKAVVTAPTCENAGYTTYTCACGDSYVADEVAALGHTYESVTTEATCTENGSIVYTCHCGDTYTEVIPALGHKYEAVVTAPTCTEAGYTTYTCACGDSYVADEVAALGHTYKAVTTEATCTENGSIVYTCHCGDTYTEVIPALGHKYEAVVTAPTCENAGYTTYTCHCGETYIADEVSALGHDLDSVVTEATCETEGYTTHTCRRCGEVTVDTIVAALGHNLKTVTVDATCTEDGSVTSTCERCGISNIEVLPALGHCYEAVVNAPTCTETGYTTYTCHCGETYTEVIPATGHTHEAVVTAPTCTEGGYTTYTCVCGDSYVADEVAALGHTYESFVTAPTCETAGYTTYTCHCGDTYVADEVAALGHSYETVVTAPTCETAGYTTHTCHCGDTYVADEVAALGHDYEAAVTAPTCETAGYTTYTCHCGDSYVADEVAALGHTYESVTTAPTCTVNGSIVYTCHCGDSYAETIAALGHSHQAVVTAPTCTEAGYTTYTCACGHSYVADEVAALGHTYESVTTEATCTENGSIVFTCHCGETYTEVIPALGHKYEAVVTAPTCETAGYTTYTCVCGDTYVADEVAALGHTYESFVTAPTCETAGYTTYTCHCGDTYVADEVAALGHSYETVVTAPTCETAGYTTYTCHCGDTYVADKVAALGHTYESVTNEATCTENGSIVYTCHCGETYTEVIEALGHKYEAVVTAPTCETTGYTTYTCHCGDTYVADEVAALGHTYESVTTEATCTENGSIVYTCHCGETYTEIIPAFGHSYETVVTAPTCTEIGYTTYTCHCGDTYVADEVAALGHTYESVTTEATCTENGSVVYTCHCGDTYTEVIPALGHKYEAVVTAPTCTEIGYTTYTCACGDSYVADEVTALGHKYEAVVTAPTCETAGYTTYTCHCGDTYVADEVAALGHTYESVTTAPTCTENGSIVYTCHCGDSYVETITALGHSHKAVVTAPTCTNQGYTTHTCHCGDRYVDSYTEATGHSYSCVENNGFLIYTCEVCGDSYSESVAWIALPKVYKLDTNGIDVGAEHKYIVVGVDKNYALTVSGTTVGSAAVTVKDNTITLDNAANYEFYFVNNNSKESGSYLLTKDGSKYVYHMGGNMYYGTDNKGYWHFGSSSNGSYQLYDNDNLKWYLNYGYVWGSDSVSRFAVSSTARYVRLFKAAETFARLSGEGFQTYAHEAGATLDTVLNKLAIQLSDNGSSVSGTLAVTSDLVTWDKNFDGITAGTYTGTVTYQGVVLGSVTVTITGEHTYETVTTEATCTTAGESVHTCTACGHSYRDNVTAALGHSYSCVEENGYFIHTCDRCGDSYSEKSISYTQVNAISAGKDYVITLYSGNKYYAVSHANNQISVVQVTVSNGEITSEITEDLLWTYSGNKLSYVSNGTTYYMYCYTNSWWGGWWGNSGTSLQLSTSNSSTVTFSGNKLKVGSYYLRYSNGSVNLNSSATTAYVFVED